MTDLPFWARRMLVKTELHKFRLYLPQIPQGMANLHRAAVFVSQITALTRKPAQYRSQQRNCKIAKVLAANSILRTIQVNLKMTEEFHFTFGYSLQKTLFSKTPRKLFHGFGLCDLDYTALYKQEMVSRCTH